MAIVAEKYDYVIGIDTHSRTHTYAIVDTTTGARIGCEAFPVTKSGMNRAIAWIRRNTTGEILAAIEGTNSYGSSIRRALIVEGVRVVEVKPPRKKTRHGVGKSDPIDAIATATSILGQETDLLLHPRRDGERAAISVLLAARRRVERQRTANRNALNALVRLIDLGVDARHALTDRQIKGISEWRAQGQDTVDQRIARAEAIDLAKSIKVSKTRLKEIETELVDLDEKMAPGMQDQFGMGPVTVGIIPAAYSHQGRVSWVTALRNTDIQKLAQDTGPLQMSLFDQQNLAEISHPDYPGERLIACRNPALAERRNHKRTSLLEATEEKLETIKKAVDTGALAGAGKIGVRVGKVLGRYNMAKHFNLVITDEKLTFERNPASIKREADLDGIYVIRTNVPQESMDAPEAVRTYKSLANVEKIFKTLKTRDLGIRPIRHYTEDRTRAHVFLCMLAAHLTWHLRTAWAPLTFTDENRPTPEEPVAKVVRSAAAARKASTRKLDNGTTATSYQGLLTHLGTRTRNPAMVPGTEKTFELLSLPTPRQYRAMDLIDQHTKNHRK